MGISRKQALECLQSDDLIGIGMEAGAVRRRLHPEGVVGYVVAGSVVCSGRDLEGRAAGDASLGDALEEIEVQVLSQVGEVMAMGGTAVRLAGNGWGAGGVGWFERMLRSMRKRSPAIWIEGFSAAEVVAIARLDGAGPRDTIARLRDAGLDSIGGQDGGVERRDWVEVHRAAHELGMRTTAAMSFGGSETAEDRVEFMETVRRLQEETGGFAAFVPCRGGGPLDGPTAVECLKTLAVSRMVLDNIENVQAGWSLTGSTAQGLKVLQTGLRFGANDAGPVMVGGAAWTGAQVGTQTGEEDVRRVIRDAGFRPVERDGPYRTMFLN